MNHQDSSGQWQRMQTLSPLRDKFSCNSQRINLAIVVTVPVELTWVHWEFSYLHFMMLVTSSTEQGLQLWAQSCQEVTAWHINISRNQWWFKITHYTTNCSSWEADWLLMELIISIRLYSQLWAENLRIILNLNYQKVRVRALKTPQYKR